MFETLVFHPRGTHEGPTREKGKASKPSHRAESLRRKAAWTLLGHA